MKPKNAILLCVRPISLRAANALVTKWHRHHKPVRGMRFALAANSTEGVTHGIVIAGRPVARAFDASEVLEITRCATDGTPNAPSMLYSAAARAAAAMGFRKVQTYTLKSESGVSLRAAGFVPIAEVIGRNWNCPSRGSRRTDQPMCNKTRWERDLKEAKGCVVQKRGGSRS